MYMYANKSLMNLDNDMRPVPEKKGGGGWQGKGTAFKGSETPLSHKQLKRATLGHRLKQSF